MSKKQFQRDLDLILANCRVYNKKVPMRSPKSKISEIFSKGSEFREIADEVEKEVVRLMKRVDDIDLTPVLKQLQV